MDISCWTCSCPIIIRAPSQRRWDGPPHTETVAITCPRCGAEYAITVEMLRQAAKDKLMEVAKERATKLQINGKTPETKETQSEPVHQ